MGAAFHLDPHSWVEAVCFGGRHSGCPGSLALFSLRSSEQAIPFARDAGISPAFSTSSRRPTLRGAHPAPLSKTVPGCSSVSVLLQHLSFNTAHAPFPAHLLRMLNLAAAFLAGMQAHHSVSLAALLADAPQAPRTVPGLTRCLTDICQ